MTTPEQRARVNIDALLSAAGWVVQNRSDMNFYAARGVAVREAYLRTGFADYLLLVDGKALGVVEAKAEGATLSGVEVQSARYGVGLQGHMQAWLPDSPLPFRYESTGVETFFTNTLDPTPRSRLIFAFHRPETLAEWAQEETTLRRRLQTMPGLDMGGLWPPQERAIVNLEESHGLNKPRALIQMATGSGKTYTAVNFVYRLIRYAGARRVLFLVDRNNLGTQALNEFQQFELPGIGRKFTDDYNVQHLQSATIDPVSKVCISTIQRLYAVLRGDAYESDERDDSLYEAEEQGALPRQPRSVSYQPGLPIETFDFIVIDECHRSIYNVWRQVLEYFDAFLIGLTATPSLQTIAFFGENLVMEYTHQDAVADGINVNGYLYEIKTRISQEGAEIPEGAWVNRRDRQSRAREQALLDEMFTYTPTQLGRSTINESQIRLVMGTVRERLFTELFPERQKQIVPKTLIFAKDDNHAEDIVRITREVFDEGNDFCQKITYRTTGRKPEDILSAFRNSYYPRIAVTVDMIATGTDVQAIEMLIFLRLVKSVNYFEQMRGRGTRIISLDKLQQVTEDAPVKDRFIIVDAVGLAEQELMDTSRPLEQRPGVPFPALVEQIVYGRQDEDTVSSLAARLARLGLRMDEEDHARIEELNEGPSLAEVTRGLLDALDYEQQTAAARASLAGQGVEREPTGAEIEAAAEALVNAALMPLRANVPLRQAILAIHERTWIVYDESNLDVLQGTGFNDTGTGAESVVHSFEEYIREHKDEITALRILFERPYDSQPLTFAAVQELAERLQQPPHSWTTEQLWRAYGQLEKDRVRGLGSQRVLTDLVALVRHAVYSDEAPLEPYPETVARRYGEWLAAQEAAGRTFSPAQRWWLDKIAEYIGVNLAIAPQQLHSGPFLARGGLFGAKQALGGELEGLLAELNEALVVV